MHHFDEQYNRLNTNCYKWDKTKELYQIDNTEGFLPMWVADMDFQIAPEITAALQERLQNPIFGYSFAPADLNEAIVRWYTKRHNWTFEPGQILHHAGVIPAIVSIIQTFTKEQDVVAISSPVYAPFQSIPANLNRQVVRVPLIEENGEYRYDFNLLAEAFKEAKLYILCNPHNPGGIVWDAETLQRIIDLAIEHDVLILSDEIHADILFNKAYTPLQTLENVDKAQIITCLAPTKTFNLASLHFAMMVPSNKELQKALEQEATNTGRGNNEFAYIATLAAYTKGEAWLDAALAYIRENMRVAIEGLNAIDGVKVQLPDGTYLLWIDARDTGIAEKEFFKALAEVGKLGLEKGSKFGAEGEGFYRMNLACPRAYVEDAVIRFKQTVESFK